MSSKSRRAQPAPAKSKEPTRGQQRYTNAFGDWGGNKLHDLVTDNTSPDKIDGYIGKLIDAGTGFLGSKATGAASKEDADAAKLFAQQLRTGLGGDYKKQVADSEIGETVSGWAEESPWSMAGIGLAAGAGYIASDPDLNFDKSKKIGKHGKITAGVDAGSLLHPSLNAATLGVGYQDGNRSMGLNGEYRFDKDQRSLDAYYKDSGDWGSLNANANWTHTDKDAYKANIHYKNDVLAAGLSGTYDSDSELGTVAATVNGLGKGNNWNVGAKADTDGAWNLNAGMSGKTSDNLEWFAKGTAGQDATGKSDFGAQVGLNYKF